MRKLLLADDSVTIQRVIELTFSGEDIQVVAVNDGEQAIARIPAEQPDVVLADIGMPRKGGYDVAAFVKARPDLSHIPVLLLAGAFEPVDQTRAEQVGADGVLIKPFEPRQVIERVKELLAAVRPTITAERVPEPPAVDAAAAPRARRRWLESRPSVPRRPGAPGRPPR
jgi:CheY-like chemotaxis protein